MLTVQKILAGALVVGATALSLPASAMPIGNPAVMRSGDAPATIDQVRWVCGPYGCRHVPNVYYGGPRYAYPRYAYGYRHGWHRGYGYGYRRW